MKILIVEDNRQKLNYLQTFISGEIPQGEVRSQRSYQSGLDEALHWKPDLIILDMSMPTYDTSPTESGGRPRSYGGRDILREISRKRLKSKAIVVTGFETFGEGEEVRTLEELRAGLAQQFPANYVTTVFFSSAETTWQEQLRNALSTAFPNGEVG